MAEQLCEIKKMRPSKVKNNEAIAAIRDVFREQGFDGASLTLLAEATGLQRASLYHRFPDGKDGMAVAVIDNVADYLEREVFASLESDSTWQDRLGVMCEQLDAYYNGGQTLCLLSAFSFGSVPEQVRRKAPRMIGRWQDCLVVLAVDAGQSESHAQILAEQILVEIQGGLILATLMNNIAPFQRVLNRLPKVLSETPEYNPSG